MKPVQVARIGILLFAAAAALTLAGARTIPVSAQQPGAQSTPGVNPAAPQPTPGPQSGTLEADDLIKVDVEHLAEWAKTNNPAKLVPYLEGLALYGDYPIEIHTTQNHLRFHLHIKPENRKTWIDLLGGPTGMRKPVIFSVGLERQSQFDTVYDQENPAMLTVIEPGWLAVAFVVIFGTLALLIWLSRTTNLIRDPGPKPIGGKHRPYNMGRSQMAFWFFMIFTSYITIWLITSALDTITASLLGLMGISAGTALGAAIIDSGKESSRVTSLKEVTAEKGALEQTIPQLQSQLEAIQAKTTMTPEDISNRDSLNKQLQDYRTRLNQVGDQVEELTPSASDVASQGFLRDILGDGHGYSFHRFQIFAWTIVLGLIFASSVYYDLTMPEFSSTLLGLMGISSGTYLGFKFPEQK
jgi:hypothetical protein